MTSMINQFLFDPRALAGLLVSSLALLLLSTATGRGKSHVRWVASAGLIYGPVMLVQAAISASTSAVPVLITLLGTFLSASALMTLYVGLRLLHAPGPMRFSRAIALVLGVPFFVLVVNIVAQIHLPERLNWAGIGTAALASFPAMKAVAIYRSDRWQGNLLLALSLAVIPVLALAAAMSGMSIEYYRRLSTYPGAFAFVMACGILLIRDALDRRRQLIDLKEARSALKRLAASLEDQVKTRTEQLEALVNGLKGFNAIVSHDLRGPLRNAAGFVDVVIEEFKSGNTDAALDALEVIRKESLRGSAMVDDLLRLSKVDEAALKTQPTDLREVFQAALEALAIDHPTAQEAVVIGPMPTLGVDAGLLKHVALNLVGNALKYGRGVSGLRVEVQASPLPNGSWRIEVSDNGPGFEREQADKVFEPFVRLHGTQVAGTGIGLTVVARVIKRHQGSVGASADIGKGARFWFTLPEQAPQD